MKFQWNAIFVVLASVVSGCAGYQLGPKSLYRPGIRTIYVPIFQSDSYRRKLGEWLTEAVAKRIELQTPYKVVGHPDADSTLEGRLVVDRKRVLAENANDEPSDIEFGMQIQIRWFDPSGQPLIERTFGIPSTLANITMDADLVPIAGQSIASAQQQAIERLAADIVGQMEKPW